MSELTCMTCHKPIEDLQPYFQITDNTVECYDCHRKEDNENVPDAT